MPNKAKAAKIEPDAEMPDVEVTPESESAAVETDSAAVAVETESAGGTQWVTYTGHAHAFGYTDAEAGIDLKLQPGVPAEVPKAIAEELATFPHETFTFADQAPVAVQQDEE